MLFTILLAAIVAAIGVVAAPAIHATTKFFYIFTRNNHDTY